MARALVVLSGGADSTTCLFWAKGKFDDVVAIAYDYGQKHSIELAAAQKVAELAEVNFGIVNLQRVLKSSSPLVDANVELETYPDFDTMTKVIGDRVELTFVPLRNTLFLVVAANRAIRHNATDLVTGVCCADGANYPDTTALFIQSVQNTINTSLGYGNDEFKIHTPLMYLSKAESVKLALTLPECYAALAYSHTAYSGEWPPVTQDHATVLRARGFAEALLPDPLLVRAYWESKLDELPPTENYTRYARILGNPNPLADAQDIYRRLYDLELYFRDM